MADPKSSGFCLRYASARALHKDYAASLSHGGMIVPWRSTPPPENTDLVLRIEAPEGTRFDLAARVGRSHGPAGFIVSFEPPAVDRARAALDTFVRGDRFRRLVEAEPTKEPGGKAPPGPVVEPFGALAEVLPEDDVTDPGFTAPDLDEVEAVAEDAAVAGLDEVDAEPSAIAAATEALIQNLDLGAVEETDPGVAAEALADALDRQTVAAERRALEVEAEADAREVDGASAGAGGSDVLDGATAFDEATAFSAEEPEEAVPAGFRRPQPGEEYLVYVVKYQAVRDFARIRDGWRATQKLSLDYAEDKARAGGVVQLRLTLPGHNVYTMFGLVDAVGPATVTLRFDENNEQFRQACLYLETPSARNRIKGEDGDGQGKPQVVRLVEVVPEEDPDKLPLRRRLQRMGMDDKINLALSGNREERMALAVDGNKAIHHYLLRNAKISLDEIAFMARLPTMNPDVLDKIAENPAYTQNPTVVKALVYNPKTPVPTAIRLLDRLPRNEVMNLAKRANMNMRLVMAAKKKIESKRV